MLRKELCRIYCKHYRDKFNDKHHWYCFCNNEMLIYTLGIKSNPPDNCPYVLEHVFETEYRQRDKKGE